MMVRVFLLIALTVSLGSCGGSSDAKRKDLPPQTSAIGVNGYLWQATIDTLHFMPMRSMDAASGVIVSDWFIAPDNTKERVQVTVSFTSESLRSDGVRVHIVRQENMDGSWVTMPVQARTELEIEEAILTQARQLRVDTLN